MGEELRIFLCLIASGNMKEYEENMNNYEGIMKDIYEEPRANIEGTMKKHF
mgnify:CR=1 FL=1